MENNTSSLNSGEDFFKQCNVEDLVWDEGRGVVTLPNGDEYRMVLVWKDRTQNVQELAEEDRKKLIEGVKTIFTETRLDYTDFDSVKISGNAIYQREREVSKLSSQAYTIITGVFHRAIHSLEPSGEKSDVEEAIELSLQDNKKREQEQARDNAFIQNIEQRLNVQLEKNPGNGDCLFVSCVQGLQAIDPNKFKDLTAEEMRKNVVSHLENNEDCLNAISAQLYNTAEVLQEAYKKDNNTFERELALYQEPLKNVLKKAVPIIKNGDIDQAARSVEGSGADLAQLYIKSMAKKNAYAGLIELGVICELYNVPIRIFAHGNNQDVGEYAIDRQHDNLHLFFSNNHYDAFLPKSEDS